MTDEMGHYVGGGKRYLPPEEIQKMKKNMKKVPVIHEKSEKFHEKEDKEAEEFINESLQDKQLQSNNEGLAINHKQKQIDNKNWFKKIFFRIRNKIKNLYTLKQK